MFRLFRRESSKVTFDGLIERGLFFNLDRRRAVEVWSDGDDLDTDAFQQLVISYCLWRLISCQELPVAIMVIGQIEARDHKRRIGNNGNLQQYQYGENDP